MNDGIVDKHVQIVFALDGVRKLDLNLDHSDTIKPVFGRQWLDKTK